MGLKYDFDICPEVSEEIVENDVRADLQGQAAGSFASSPRPVAMFRDVRTSDALRRASPRVRQLFLASGFRLGVYDSGAPEGFYPAEDEAVRHLILSNFVENMKNTPLRGEYCGDFDFSEFMEHILAAKPILEERDMTKKTTPEPEQEVQRPERKSVLGRVIFAVSIAVLALLALKWLSATIPN
ncbi:MAG: hypothetical protein AB3N21_07560 [Ruegeria sp.]|uniref:hypothetical protein n=1 Tax=Ruegeria sp. TaxID=1879320 RepID=UPI00349E8610